MAIKVLHASYRNLGPQVLGHDKSIVSTLLINMLLNISYFSILCRKQVVCFISGKLTR